MMGEFLPCKTEKATRANPTLQSGRVQIGKELSIDRRVKPTVTRTAYLSFSIIETEISQ